MQHEMYANHTRAFAALSNQLLQAMLFLKEFTDTGIGKVSALPPPTTHARALRPPIQTRARPLPLTAYCTTMEVISLRSN
jgi:hypothetical protein